MTVPYYDHDGITIYHGDSLELADVWADADVMVTDPPYGIAYDSNRYGTVAREASPLARSIGPSDDDTSVRDAALAAWGDRPSVVFGSPKLPPVGGRQPIIWHKPGMGMGDLSYPFRPDYEHIYVIGDGFASDHRGSSVLTFPMSNPTKRRDAKHPHAKPIGLMRHLIERCPPGVIVDPFMGSGSTLRAAKDLGRTAIGIEIDERYCEVAAKRLSQQVLDLGDDFRTVT